MATLTRCEKGQAAHASRLPGFQREESEHSFLAAVYVEVLEAAELAGHKGKKRARSAFVDIEVGRQKYQTETTKNANHPRWDEAATFFVADLETPSLRLTVKEAGVDAATNQITRLAQTAARAADYAAGAHARLSKDVVLGDLVISLSSDFGDRWLPLQNARSGRVHVVVTPLYLDRRTFPEPQKRSTRCWTTIIIEDRRGPRSGGATRAPIHAQLYGSPRRTPGPARGATRAFPKCQGGSTTAGCVCGFIVGTAARSGPRCRRSATRRRCTSATTA